MSKSKIIVKEQKGHVCVCDNCLSSLFLSEADGLKLPDGWATLDVNWEGHLTLWGDFCSTRCVLDYITKNTLEMLDALKKDLI